MSTAKDIKIGTRFNKLVTIEEIDTTDKYDKVLCKCDCGNITKVMVGNLKSRAKACGKCRGNTAVIGDKFGRWTAIENSFIENSCTKVLCKCECGTIKEMPLYRLNCSRPTLSCGCLAKDVNTKHGKAKSRIYQTYNRMMQRCYNPKTRSYPTYGAKGITVCEEWKNDFLIFEKWALENGYNENLQIDRKNNHLGYSPDNCRWATPAQNAWNRRPRKPKYKGVEKRGNKYASYIGKGGKLTYLGIFDTQEEAALAYNEKAIELFGEFACLNEIIPSHPTDIDTENPHMENL